MSACLIVRNEQDRLSACLESVSPFVDEVVVCDTGSSDATVSLASRLGARVIQTRWADDFAAARNVAMRACASEWVLSVDADETVHGVPAWVAPLLEACAPEVPALTVQIDNAQGPDARGLTSHRETKLVRRGHARWEGRVHERLIGENGALPAAELPSQALTLVHHGYDTPAAAIAKAQRNARLCERELEHQLTTTAAAVEVARAALDLGRSQLGCGRPDLAAPALHLCRSAASRSAAGAAIWQWATDFLARLELSCGQIDEAATLIDELSLSGAPSDYCRWLVAQVAAQRGDADAAAPQLATIGKLVDLSGNELSLDQVWRMTSGPSA